MSENMMEDLAGVLVSEEQLKTRIKELGAQISKDYEGKYPLIVGILKGSFVFLADLARAITIPAELDFMSVSSYGSGSTTTGVVKIKKDLDVNPGGRHVIIVEDIVDSGVTLAALMKMMETKNLASIKLCTLLDKPERRQAEVHVDYTGFTVPNEFVVGYGLDYDQKYRNLPFIGILAPKIYEK